MEEVSALRNRRFLNPGQRNQLKQESRRLEWAIKGRSMFDGENLNVAGLEGGRTPEPDLLKENLDRVNRMLERGTPPELTPYQKNRLHKRMRDVEQRIADGMPSTEMMERPTPQNIDWHMAWEKAKKQDIVEWKALRRALDPSNQEVNFTNVELLRQTDPPKGDPRKYWENFDKIQWEADNRAEDTIDDKLYLEFLKLYAKDWSKKSIKEELALTEDQWRVCCRHLHGPDEGQNGNGDHGQEEQDLQSMFGDATPEEAKPPKPEPGSPEDLEGRDLEGRGTKKGVFGRPATKTKDAWLRREIEARGVSIKEFGRVLGVRHQTLYLWMKRDKVPPQYVEGVREALRKIDAKIKEQEEEQQDQGGAEPTPTA